MNITKEPRRNWQLIVAFTASCYLYGCTSMALQTSTLSVSSTVAPILEQQALENLGRFIDDNNAIPSHILLGNGIVEITNATTPLAKGTFAHAATNSVTRELDIPLTLQWKETWDVTAVSSGDDLTGLQKHYKVAVNNKATDPDKGCVSANNVNWLCVDPLVTPSTEHHLVNKGIHNGHRIWVDSEGFSKFVFNLASKDTTRDAATKSLNSLQLQLQ